MAATAPTRRCFETVLADLLSMRFGVAVKSASRTLIGEERPKGRVSKDGNHSTNPSMLRDGPCGPPQHEVRGDGYRPVSGSATLPGPACSCCAIACHSCIPREVLRGAKQQSSADVAQAASRSDLSRRWPSSIFTRSASTLTVNGLGMNETCRSSSSCLAMSRSA